MVTSSELISELAKVHHLFEWELVPDTGAGSEQRSQPRLWIRGTGKDGPDGLVFEPIGAVCFAQTATPYGDDMWMEAATTLGLSETDARDLLDASNDSTWRPVDGRREPDSRLESLRKRLAEAVRLRMSIFKLDDRVKIIKGSRSKSGTIMAISHLPKLEAKPDQPRADPRVYVVEFGDGAIHRYMYEEIEPE